MTEHFGERVRVCALDDLVTVGPQEIGLSAIVIVATIQSFNVKDKTIRTVYSFDESLARHFQELTPQLAAPRLEDSFRYAFTFLPNHYPARPPFYSGRFKFRHHYYPVIHDLREKRADGTPAEEFVCAQAIDNDPMIKHWVRNVEKEDRFSFWLPTATDYFYPDFICELTDGRLLVLVPVDGPRLRRRGNASIGA